jgi:hypothetical protein
VEQTSIKQSFYRTALASGSNFTGKLYQYQGQLDKALHDLLVT